MINYSLALHNLKQALSAILIFLFPHVIKTLRKLYFAFLVTVVLSSNAVEKCLQLDKNDQNAKTGEHKNVLFYRTVFCC